MNLRLKTKKLQGDLLVGLVGAGMFAYLFDPAVKAMWNFMSNSAFSWAERFQESALRSAALGQRNWLDTCVFFLITTSLICLLMNQVVRIHHLLKSIKTVANKLNRATSNAQENSEEKSEKPTNSLFLKTGLFISRNSKLISWATAIVAIFAAINLLIFAIMAFIDLQLVTSFNQRLTAVAPYIDPIEEKKLKSQWALME